MARISFILILGFASTLIAQEKDGVVEKEFSGPQVGESLPALVTTGVFDDLAGKPQDLIKQGDGKTAIIIFVHQFTRPSIQVLRGLSTYAENNAEKVHGSIVFLTDDIPEMEATLSRARRALPQKTIITTSPDGLEGPGSYGLNRKMTLTVLVAKDGKVTGNHAFVSTTAQTDVLEVVNPIAKSIGQRPPTLAQLGMVQTRPAPNTGGVNVRALLGPVINKMATEEMVNAAAKRAEAIFAKNKAAATHVAGIAQRIIDTGRLESYGTKRGQYYLKKWAEQFGPKKDKEESKSPN